MRRWSQVLWISTLCLLFACQGSQTSEGEETKEEEPKVAKEENDIPSPRREARGTLDNVAILVDYGSPAVKGREIWGKLEEYGKVWRAGANATTSISFDKNVIINGEKLPAGKYALFMIPTESAWTVIFNKDWDEWGAFNYDGGQDVIRLQVNPQWEDEVVERLSYSISNASLDFAWEKVRISMTLTADSE